MFTDINQSVISVHISVSLSLKLSSLLITAWGDSAEALLKAGDVSCVWAEPQAWVSALCVCSGRELCVFTNISGSAGGRRKRGQGGQLFLLVSLCLVPGQSLPTRGHVCAHLVALHTAQGKTPLSLCLYCFVSVCLSILPPLSLLQSFNDRLLHILKKMWVVLAYAEVTATVWWVVANQSHGNLRKICKI